MAKYLITRTDFDSMENNYIAAQTGTDIGIAPNEKVAEALLAKYKKVSQPHQYYGWGDYEKKKPYPQFHMMALCELQEAFLSDDYDCQKLGEHAPISSHGLCLSCGMTKSEIKREKE